MRSLTLILLVAVLFSSIQAAGVRGLTSSTTSTVTVNNCVTVNGETRCDPQSSTTNGPGSVSVHSHVHYP